VVAGRLWPDGYHQQLFAVAFFCEVWVPVSSTLVEGHCCPQTGLDTAVQNRQIMQLLNMTVLVQLHVMYVPVKTWFWENNVIVRKVEWSSFGGCHGQMCQLYCIGLHQNWILLSSLHLHCSSCQLSAVLEFPGVRRPRDMRVLGYHVAALAICRRCSTAIEISPGSYLSLI